MTDLPRQVGRYRIDGFPVMKRAGFKVEPAETRRGARSKESTEKAPYFGRELYLNIEPGAGFVRLMSERVVFARATLNWG